VASTHALYGKPVGSYLGKTIYGSIEKDTTKYIFDRIAECDSEGGCPLDQLHKNEVLFEPGLIYKVG
jgi:hypothetical protein